MAPSHLYRFANEALPETVFENPLAFSRGIANPLKVQTLLGAIWDRAGGRMAGADRQTREGMAASVVRLDPFTVVHIQPPFAREVGDACAIVLVGRGDGENQFDDVRYFIVELTVDTATNGPRFVLVSRSPDAEHATNLGDAPPDLSGIIEQCVERASGKEPAPRERFGTVAPWYWWHVHRGADVMRVFVAAPESEAWSVIHQHPILLLPELVTAGEHAGIAARPIEGLRQMHASLRGTPHFAPFHRMLAAALASTRGGSQRLNIEKSLATLVEVRASVADGGAELGRALAEEAALRARLAGMGIDPRRNYERARELYETARKEPAEPADRERDEREALAVGAALAAMAPPAPKTADPTWAALFLDETELGAFQRREDRRDENPNPSDRSFAEFCGVAAGSVVWLGNEAWPMWRVIDTRWLFPSVVNAMAYADAMLAHAGEGLPTLPVPVIGDAARGWGGIQLGRVPGTRYAGQIVFFRVGRMVAKLFAAEGPTAPQAGQALSQSMLFPLAEAIVRRAQWALPRYWLGIARGTEAANTFVQTPPQAAVALLSQYPILALPEFPAAMATLGEAHRVAAQALWNLQESFKTDYSWRNVIRPLVRSLLDDRSGEPRVNAHTALALVLDIRRVDRDPAWATIEAECRARA